MIKIKVLWLKLTTYSDESAITIISVTINIL